MAISESITLNESSDVILFCNATGTPTPNVTWSTSGDQDKNFNPGSLLSLKNISRAEDGLYWCTAENGAGNSMASVRVNVQCKCQCKAKKKVKSAFGPSGPSGRSLSRCP